MGVSTTGISTTLEPLAATAPLLAKDPDVAFPTSLPPTTVSLFPKSKPEPLACSLEAPEFLWEAPPTAASAAALEKAPLNTTESSADPLDK